MYSHGISKDQGLHKEMCGKSLYGETFKGMGQLKALDTIVITQNNFQHKNLLGNKQWRAVDSIKHCEDRLPLKQRSFRERSIWKHTTSCDKGVFSSIIISQLQRPWSPNLHRFVILCIYWDTLSENTGILAITKGVPCLYCGFCAVFIQRLYLLHQDLFSNSPQLFIYCCIYIRLNTQSIYPVHSGSMPSNTCKLCLFSVRDRILFPLKRFSMFYF